MLAEGKIRTEELELLINSDKDLVKMESLKIAGLAQIRVRQFIESLFNMIANIILKFTATYLASLT